MHQHAPMHAFQFARQRALHGKRAGAPEPNPPAHPAPRLPPAGPGGLAGVTLQRHRCISIAPAARARWGAAQNARGGPDLADSPPPVRPQRLRSHAAGTSTCSRGHRASRASSVQGWAGRAPRCDRWRRRRTGHKQNATLWASRVQPAAVARAPPGARLTRRQPRAGSESHTLARARVPPPGHGRRTLWAARPHPPSPPSLGSGCLEHLAGDN